VMMTFIDQHRETFGVESICAMLPVAPSTYFRWKAQQREPTRRSPRAQRDEILLDHRLRVRVSLFGCIRRILVYLH
jgi:putative transposase